MRIAQIAYHDRIGRKPKPARKIRGPHTEASKLKMSIARSGITDTPEARERKRLAGLARWARVPKEDRKTSDAAKAKQRVAKLGKPWSAERRAVAVRARRAYEAAMREGEDAMRYYDEVIA